MKKTWTMLAGLVLLGGCLIEPEDTDNPQPGTPGARTDHLGAWYGQGMEFPDGDLCLLLCENGRAFLGDRLCTDTTASDFQGYYTFTRTGDVLTVSGSMGTVAAVSIRSLSGDTGIFILQGRDLPMSRTAPTSPMCTDPARTAR